MPEFPKQVLDEGEQVYFGQSLQEVEKLFGVVSSDNPSRIARKGIDKIIKTKGVCLEFDVERLKGMEFEENYQFRSPPQPYAESWKNFVSIGDSRIRPNMGRDEFIAYILAWEARAEGLGAEKMESADLNENQYRVAFENDKFFNMFHAAMGPSRRAGGGGIWCDGWTAFFGMETPTEINKGSVNRLKSLSAHCDLFNTVARRRC